MQSIHQTTLSLTGEAALSRMGWQPRCPALSWLRASLRPWVTPRHPHLSSAERATLGRDHLGDGLYHVQAEAEGCAPAGRVSQRCGRGCIPQGCARACTPGVFSHEMVQPAGGELVKQRELLGCLGLAGGARQGRMSLGSRHVLLNRVSKWAKVSY